MSPVLDELLADVSDFIRLRPTSILITGDVTHSRRAEILQLIAAASGMPLVHAQTGIALVLPDRPDSILVVDALDALSPDEQQELYRWLNRHPGQVISFATTSIYPMVQSGSFSEALFYRLNVITTALDFGARGF